MREAEVRLKSVVNSAMDAIIAIDDQQRIVLFNSAAEKMFACKAEEALGKTIDRFIPPAFRSGHREHLRHFSESGVTSRAMSSLGTLWGLRATGEEFPIEASISQAEIEGRKLFTAIIRDTTERRRMLDAQRLNEERLHLAVKAGKMYAFEWDAETDRIIRSPEYEEVVGADQPLLIRRQDFLACVHPDDRNTVAGLFGNNTPENPISQATYRLVRPDGTVLWQEKRAQAFFDDQGKLLRTIGVTADISDRKIAEQALRESEQRFRLVANTAPVLIWMAGVDKLCTYFNQPWLDFTGRALEAELGNGWAEAVHPQDVNVCLATYSEAFEERCPFKMTYRLRRHDGEYRWVSDNGVPRFNPDGSFAGYIGSCVDVTDEKLAAEALASVRRRLMEAHEEERTWIARELHDDINQQIALVAIELERWNQGTQHPVPDAYLQHARQRLLDISKDVQSLSHRLHSSKLEYLGIVAAARSFCRELSERQKVNIEFTTFDIPSAIPPEVGLCLFRVLQEALHNAVKHSGAPQFKVMLGGLPHEIQLVVTDQGTGFDLKSTMAGQGLGLISMRERVQLLNGELSIESAKGRGTTICARVPLTTEQFQVSKAG
ncbi:MAG TPA: PAS domain S-box protein [Terriglobales bacterium]